MPHPIVRPARTARDDDFGPSHATSDPRLRYVRYGHGHWRFVEVGTGRNIGGLYRTERDLLADVARVGRDLEKLRAERDALQRKRARRRGGPTPRQEEEG